MTKLIVHEAKTHLLEYFAKRNQGETIVMCKRNRPTAEIRQIPALSDAPRPIGLAKVIFEVPASFFEPLPQSIMVMLVGQAIAQGLVILEPRSGHHTLSPPHG